MTKYALIVDPFSSGSLYAEALRKYDIIPLALISHTPINSSFKSSFNEKDFAHVFIYNQHDETLFHELASVLNDANLLLVLPGTETGIELADKLADHFCPHLSNGTKLSSSRRNKFDMAEQLKKFNITVPRAIQSNVLADILSWVKQHHLLPSGVVIKPLNSGGTDGVNACFTEAQIESAVQQLLGTINQLNYRNELVLAQEFLSGTEYVIDSASYQGIHTITNICCYKKTQANGSKFVYDYLDFLPATGTLQEELAAYTFQILTSLGIKYGPAHSEIIYTSCGPRFIETGARLHGGIAIPACRLATGSSQLDLTLDFFLHKSAITKNHIGFKLKKYTRIVFLISYTDEWVVAEHANMEIVKKLTSLAMLKILVKSTSRLKKTIDLFSIPGLLILNHESNDQLEEDYKQLRKLEKEGLFVTSSQPLS